MKFWMQTNENEIVISKTIFFFTFFQCPQWCLIFLIMSKSLTKKSNLLHNQLFPCDN